MKKNQLFYSHTKIIAILKIVFAHISKKGEFYTTIVPTKEYISNRIIFC